MQQGASMGNTAGLPRRCWICVREVAAESFFMGGEALVKCVGYCPEGRCRWRKINSVTDYAYSV